MPAVDHMPSPRFGLFLAIAFLILSLLLLFVAWLLSSPDPEKTSLISSLIYAILTLTSPASWALVLSHSEEVSEFVVTAALVAHYPLVGFVWGWRRPIAPADVGSFLGLAVKRFLIFFGVSAIPGIALAMVAVAHRS